MMRSHYILFLSFGLLVGGMGGCASIAPPAQEVEVAHGNVLPLPCKPLTSDGAVVRALAYDPQMRAARHRVSAVAWQTLGAALPANPRLSASLDPVEWVVRLSARITDLLDLGGQRRAETRAAQYRKEQAALEVRLRQIELVRQVRSDVFETWAHREMVHIRRRFVAVLEDLVDIAQAQRDLGDLSAFDVLRLEQRLLEARMAAGDQEVLERQAAARLNSRLGLPLSVEIELAHPSNTFGRSMHRTPFPMSADRDSGIIDLGFLRRPELALIAAKAQEHRFLLRAARVSWLDVEAGPLLKRGDGPTVAGGQVVLTLPIFDRGQVRRGVQASLLAAFEQDMLAVQAALLIEVHAAWWTLRRAERRFLVDLPAVRDQAAARHTLLQQAAGLGASSAVEEQLAFLEILDVDLALTGAHLSWLLAQAALAAAIGDSGDNGDIGLPANGM